MCWISEPSTVVTNPHSIGTMHSGHLLFQEATSLWGDDIPDARDCRKFVKSGESYFGEEIMYIYIYMPGTVDNHYLMVVSIV